MTSMIQHYEYEYDERGYLMHGDGRPLLAAPELGGSTACKAHSHGADSHGTARLCQLHHPVQHPCENSYLPYCIACGAGIVS